MEDMTPDIAALYLEFLNGGAPLNDWQETKEWAENICRVRGTENDDE